MLTPSGSKWFGVPIGLVLEFCHLLASALACTHFYYIWCVCLTFCQNSLFSLLQLDFSVNKKKKQTFILISKMQTVGRVNQCFIIYLYLILLVLVLLHQYHTSLVHLYHCLTICCISKLSDAARLGLCIFSEYCCLTCIALQQTVKFCMSDGVACICTSMCSCAPCILLALWLNNSGTNDSAFDFCVTGLHSGVTHSQVRMGPQGRNFADFCSGLNNIAGSFCFLHQFQLITRFQI